VRRLIIGFAVAVLGLVSLAPGANAVGLDILAGGGSLTSGNGRLVFDDFNVVATGSVSNDLSDYQVVALVDGFAITGPIWAAGGDTGGLSIAYTVTAASEITAASLRFNGVAFGRQSLASVSESIDEPVDVELFVFDNGRRGRHHHHHHRGQRVDRLNLEGFTQMRVVNELLVDSSDGWGLAAISRIEERFKTSPIPVPEPAALLLIGAALLGLALARNRSGSEAA